MKKIIGSIVLIFTIYLAYYCFYDDFNHNNDAIYYHGDIITMQDSSSKTEAIYVKNGIIKAIGSLKDLAKFKSQNTKMIDLNGKTLMPGFIDPHGHIDLATVFYDMIDISGNIHPDKNEVGSILKNKSKLAKKGDWLFFYGLDPILTKGIETPSIKFLDKISPDKPLVIITKALHVFYLNSMALNLLGINKSTPDPSKASYYEKDKNGNLTGAVVEQEALEPVRQKILEISKKAYLKNTEMVFEANAKLGISSNVLMGMANTDKNILSLYQHLCASKTQPLLKFLSLLGKLPTRKPQARLFVYLKHEYDNFLPEKSDNTDDFFKIMGIKMWYDGSPYSGSMYLEKPYISSKFTIEDIHLAHDHTSASLIKPAELEKIIEKYQKQNWQIAIHAQGDQAAKEVIDAFIKVNQKLPIFDYRNRIEHVMLLPVSVMAGMQKMNLTASFHINHLLFYGEFLKDQVIGNERTNEIFPIKSFSKTKIPFSLHADMPQFVPNPLSLASTAVNRVTKSGLLINANEKISVWEALKSITINAAWQLHMDKKLGTLEPGKYADMVILDQNPLKIDPKEIGNIKVLETFVAGNSIWKK